MVSGPPSFRRSSRRQATRATTVQSTATTAILLAFTALPPIFNTTTTDHATAIRAPQAPNEGACAISARLMQTQHDSSLRRMSAPSSLAARVDRAASPRGLREDLARPSTVLNIFRFVLQTQHRVGAMRSAMRCLCSGPKYEQGAPSVGRPVLAKPRPARAGLRSRLPP